MPRPSKDAPFAYTDSFEWEVVTLTEEVQLLETHPKQDGLRADPCILPLVVLFSIAAQENRAAGPGRHHFRRGYSGLPGGVRPAPYGVTVPRRRLRGMPVQRVNRFSMF